MEQFIGLSAWNMITEYFFSEHGKLVFVHSKKYQTVDENGSLKKPQLLSELRCYYENSRLIKTVGTFSDDGKKDFIKESQNLVAVLKLTIIKFKISFNPKTQTQQLANLRLRKPFYAPTYFRTFAD